MTPAALEGLVLDALHRAGAAPHQAGSVARSVRRAEEDGIRPVGLGYLPTYLAHLRGGKVRGDTVPQVTRPLVLALDPAGFAPGFAARLATLAQSIVAERCVRLPGDRRLAAREAAARDRIAVPPDLLARIDEAGR
jgi:(2R)-3-sulfolactate dehydrogenase (NADP+)